MRRTVPLSPLIVGMVFGLLPVGAHAQGAWHTYVDPAFGTTITYPTDLLPRAEQQQYGVRLEGGMATLEISAMQIEDVHSAADLRRRIEGTPGYESITYSRGGARWLVVSGYRGPDIYYEKFFVRDGTVQGFSFEYPTADRQLYDPILERMEDSFHPG